MAQIKIKCPNKDCGKTLLVDSEMAGKKGKCSTCDAVFLIPGTPNPDKKLGSDTVNLTAAKAGESSGETKKGSASGTQKAPKGGSGSSKKPSEKFLDDYVEKPGSKPARPKRGSDEYVVEEVDYVDYAEEKPPRRSRPARTRDDDYEDYEDYDDYDAPRGRRRRDDYEEDYDDSYEDPYDDGYGETVRRGGRGRRKSEPKIGLIRAGFLILAIAGCVFCGSIGIKLLVELIGILSNFDVGKTSWTIWRIAELLWMGAAIGVIVAYSFLLFFPNRNSSLGLTIAALVIGSINLVVQIVIKIIPMFSDASSFLDLGFGGMGFGGSKIEPFIKIGLIEGLFIAEIILIAVAMMAINQQLKDRHNVQSAKRMIIPAGLYGGILIVIALFLLIVSESSITSPTARDIWKWVIYLCRVGSQGMLIWYFVSYILLMFNTRSAMPKS